MSAKVSAFYLIPDPELEQQSSKLRSSLDQAAHMLQTQGTQGFWDPLLDNVFRQGLRSIGAHEGTLWLLDGTESALIPRVNTGPNSAKLLSEIRQTLEQGLISMVLVTDTTFHSDRVYADSRQDRTTDQTLGSLTTSMAAVPFAFAGRSRGVISAVTLKSSEADSDPTPIPAEATHRLGETAALLGRLFEHRLMTLITGLAVN